MTRSVASRIRNGAVAMWSATASLFLGIVGWFATSLFAKPFLDFLTLRGLVFQEMIFTANVDQIVEGTPAYWTAVETLRRLGAKYWQPTSQHHDSCGGSFQKGDMT